MNNSKSWADNIWVVRCKVLFLSAVMAAFGNWIYTGKTTDHAVTPVEAIPGLIIMTIIIFMGYGFKALMEKIPKWPKTLPVAMYMTIINTFIAMNGSPLQGPIVKYISPINLMALCTPILAYAGISIGKDLDEFRKQGVKIVIVSLLTFIGTFIGSAIIAQVVLAMTGGLSGL